MANVTKIQLPSGNEYAIKDAGALQLTGGTVTGPTNFENSVSIDDLTAGNLVVNGGASFTNGVQATNYNGGKAFYTVIGTQTETTASWTGNIGLNALYDGLTIDYYLPRTSATDVTLNLTFANGTTSGAIPVYYTSTTRMTTHYGAGSHILLTYYAAPVINGTSYSARWIGHAQYDSNTVDRLRDSYFRPYAGEAVYRYKFVLQGADNRMYPIVVTNQEDATQVAKVPTQVGLRPGRIWYYNTTATVAAAGLFGAQTLDKAFATTISVYNFNTDIPAYRMVYLRGTYNKTTDLFTLYKDSSSPCTSYYTTVPTNTENITLSSYFTSGYYYMLLGGSYSSANYISLFVDNPLYYFDGTNLIPVSTKVAQDTNTNTTYTFANGTNGFTVTPSGGSAQTVTVTPSITNNITGSGTANKIPKFTAANTIGDGYGVTDNSSSTAVTSSDTNLITGRTLYYAGYTKNSGTITKVTTTAGAHTAVDVSSGNVSFNVPTTAAHVGAAASSHTHGNIQNGGTLQTTDVSIASGDKLVVTDSSDSNKVARSSLAFTNSTSKFLREDGTWADPPGSGSSISYVTKTENTYTTTSSSSISTIPIGIQSYASTDVLLVDINGLDLIQGTDYTISGTNIILTTPITTSGTKVHFTALKMTTATTSDYATLKGEKGDDGHSPVVTASKSGTTTTVYVDGSSIASINDGINGTHTISYTPIVTGGAQIGTITIDNTSYPLYAPAVVWG